MSSGYIVAAAIGQEYLNYRSPYWNSTSQKLVGKGDERKTVCESFINRITDFTNAQTHKKCDLVLINIDDENKIDKKEFEVAQKNSTPILIKSANGIFLYSNPNKDWQLIKIDNEDLHSFEKISFDNKIIQRSALTPELINLLKKHHTPHKSDQAEILFGIIANLGTTARRIEAEKDSYISTAKNVMTQTISVGVNIAATLFSSTSQDKSSQPEDTSFSEALHAMRTILAAEFKNDYPTEFQTKIQSLEKSYKTAKANFVKELNEKSTKIAEVEIEKDKILLNLDDLQYRRFLIKTREKRFFPTLPLPKDHGGTPTEHGQTKFDPEFPRVYHDDYWLYYIQTLLSKSRQTDLKTIDEKLNKTKANNPSIDIGNVDLKKILDETKNSPGLTQVNSNAT